MVLAIAGILSGLASVSVLPHLPHLRLQHVVRDLVSDLRWARQMALSEGRPVLLRLDLEKDLYWIERSSDPGAPVGGYREIGRPLAGFGGIDLAGSSGGDTLTFYPQGTTNTMTTLTLLNTAGEQKKVTVVVTGRVKVL